jgi:hypothetical protein
MQYTNSTSLKTLSLFLSKDNSTDNFDWQDALSEINRLISLAAKYIEVSEHLTMKAPERITDAHGSDVTSTQKKGFS